MAVKLKPIIGKFKVSQNRSQADAESVADALGPSHPMMAEAIRIFHSDI